MIPLLKRLDFELIFLSYSGLSLLFYLRKISIKLSLITVCPVSDDSKFNCENLKVEKVRKFSFDQ